MFCGFSLKTLNQSKKTSKLLLQNPLQRLLRKVERARVHPDDHFLYQLRVFRVLTHVLLEVKRFVPLPHRLFDPRIEFERVIALENHV